MKQAAKIGCGCSGLGLVGLIGLAILGALLSADEQISDEVVLAASPEPVSSKREQKPESDLSDLSWPDDEEEDLAAEGVRARFPLLPEDFELASPETIGEATWELAWQLLELWLAGVAMEPARWEIEAGESNRCIELMRKNQARAKDIQEQVKSLPLHERLGVLIPGLDRCITCVPQAMKDGCQLASTEMLRLLLEHDRVRRTP